MVYNNLTGYLGQTRNFTEDPFTRLPVGALQKVVLLFRTFPIY